MPTVARDRARKMAEVVGGEVQVRVLREREVQARFRVHSRGQVHIHTGAGPGPGQREGKGMLLERNRGEMGKGGPEGRGQDGWMGQRMGERGGEAGKRAGWGEGKCKRGRLSRGVSDRGGQE
jgi:hypothetical protein